MLAAGVASVMRRIRRFKAPRSRRRTGSPAGRCRTYVTVTVTVATGLRDGLDVRAELAVEERVYGEAGGLGDELEPLRSDAEPRLRERAGH
jgi:hypothetical protein